MRRYWFGDLAEDDCTPAPRDLPALAARAATLSGSMEDVPLHWQDAVACGFAADRAGYMEFLHRLCVRMAREQVEAYYRRTDVELVQMVRMLDELDHVINLLSERAFEWYSTRKTGISTKYRNAPQRKALDAMRRERGTPLSSLAAQIERLADERTRLAKAVSYRAIEIAPNCSELVGGLVAARLIARAGGLISLAMMPSSTIQVIGARGALFSHLRSGSPPPKHGLLFQHRRVHNAPRERRGRVARVLSAKLAIAARIDHFRGEADPAFLEAAQARIDMAGGIDDSD
jgi:nucleolar protein 56